MQFSAALFADAQSAIAMQPGEYAFDHGQEQRFDSFEYGGPF